MRVTTQLLAGHLLALAAIVAIWTISYLQIGALEEDRNRVAEEWRETETVTRALAAFHRAQSEPGARSELVTAALRLERVAARTGDDPHDRREAALLRGVADLLRQGEHATDQELDDLEEQAHGAASSFWREDEGYVTSTLDELELRALRLRRLNLAIGSGLVLSALLFFWYLLAGISRPLAAIQRRVEGIGGLKRGHAGMGELEQAIERMARVVESRQLELEAVVETRTEQLRHADRLGGLGKIAAAVAHEINNPLASIGLCIDGMRKSLAEGRVDRATLEPYLETVRAEIDRCTRTTRTMLTYARYKPAGTATFELAAIARHALNLVAGHAHAARVAVELEEKAPGLRMHGDAGQIQQVFVNLLLNAIDASPAGETVRLSAAREDGDIVVRCEDRGPGVPPERRDEVFRPFFTTKRPGQGSGLGLAISEEIVEAHGGRLSLADSRTGAVFEVRLPLEPR